MATELSPHWAGRPGAERRDQGETRKGARIEEAELAGVDVDEHALAAHRGCRLGHTSDGEQGEIAAVLGCSVLAGAAASAIPICCTRRHSLRVGDTNLLYAGIRCGDALHSFVAGALANYGIALRRRRSWASAMVEDC